MTERKNRTLRVAPALAANAVPPAPVAVVAAVKALHTGTASAHQQQIALQWIVREGAGKAHFPYHPDPLDTAFALGRYFVGDLVVGMFNAELSSLRRAPDHVETTAPTS